MLTFAPDLRRKCYLLNSTTQFAVISAAVAGLEAADYIKMITFHHTRKQEVTNAAELACLNSKV